MGTSTNDIQRKRRLIPNRVEFSSASNFVHGTKLTTRRMPTVSGPDLAESLEVSRAAVWKHVEELREAGFEIESGPAGYELLEVAAYGSDAVEFGLEAPFSLEYHDSIGSTNARAREVAVDGATDVAVLADEQTGGRGRLEREWTAPAGGVWISIVDRPEIAPSQATLYTLAAAVATARAAREAGVDARIKWPNDVVVPVGEDGDYRKLSGILTEMEAEMDRVEWLIVGLGINANIDVEDLPEGATSIREEAGDVDRGDVINGFAAGVLEIAELHSRRNRTRVDDIQRVQGCPVDTCEVNCLLDCALGVRTAVSRDEDIVVHSLRQLSTLKIRSTVSRYWETAPQGR